MGKNSLQNFPKGVQVFPDATEAESIRIVIFSPELTRSKLGEVAVKISCTPELRESGLFNGQISRYVDTDCFHKAVVTAGSLLVDPESLAREPESGMQYS